MRDAKSKCGSCTQRTYNRHIDPSVNSSICGVYVNQNLKLAKTSTDEYVRKLGSKYVAREIEVEIWVDLGLVRNESNHPTEGDSSPDGLAIKRPLTQTPVPSKLLHLNFICSSCEQGKRKYIQLCLCLVLRKQSENLDNLYYKAKSYGCSGDFLFILSVYY